MAGLVRVGLSRSVQPGPSMPVPVNPRLQAPGSCSDLRYLKILVSDLRLLGLGSQIIGSRMLGSQIIGSRMLGSQKSVDLASRPILILSRFLNKTSRPE